MGFIAASALLLYSFFPAYKTAALLLWPAVFVWCWLRWFFKEKIGVPFSFALFRFFPDRKAFADSIRALRIERTILFSIPLFALSFLIVRPSIALWLPLWILTAASQISLRKNQSRIPPYRWIFPSEQSRYLDPKYPLLRHTDRFQGKKRFELIRGEKPHVLFIFLESFRAKNVGCLGGSPAVSPHFDRLAEKGILFTQFYANGLQTYRAMISSFFGIPAHLKTASLEPFCSIPLIGLPQILKENGYRTALFQGSPTTFDWMHPFLDKTGFETILGKEHFPLEEKTSWGITDEALFREAGDWLKKQDQPTFLSIFTISNHHPWELPFPAPKTESLQERYLQTFAYTDRCLGQFVDGLRHAGILERSLVFVLADHGQEIQTPCGHRLSEDNIHIPLLILGDQKVVIDEPASQVDLLPTLLDLLSIQAAHHSVGRSLIREGSAPVFASIPSDESQMICINGNNAKSYFKTVEELFAQSAWAPASGNPPSAILDLSMSLATDSAIFELDKNRALKLHECNFSNAPLISDEALEWIGAHCPNLSILNMNGCPMITEKGMSAIFRGCPSLRSLSLEGNREMGTIPITKESVLEALHLKNCPQIGGDALVHIASHCPRLIYLAASLEHSADSHLTSLGKCLHQLQYLYLENRKSITDSALKTFLAANPNLKMVIIDDSIEMSKIPP